MDFTSVKENITVTTVTAFFAALSAISFAVLYLIVKLLAHIPRKPHKSELLYRTTTSEKGKYSELKPLPAKNSSAQDSILLSVVVPCYNETGRLKVMMDEAVDYLRNDKVLKGKFEFVIVDDGSKDDTYNFALSVAESYELSPGIVRVVKLEQNRGKGGAVTHGLQYTRGIYSVFADADGASRFSDVSKLIAAVEKHQQKNKPEVPVVAVGSRAHMVNTDVVVKRSFIRNFLMYSLHTLLFVFGIREVKDTQCGFKLFNKSAIGAIMPFMHNERWIFDVEILILALRKGIVIEEIPISWHEVTGSKIDLARDSINMAIDLVVIRFAYILGIYRDKSKTE